MNSGDRWLVEPSVRELRDQFGIDLTDHLQRTGLIEPFDVLNSLDANGPSAPLGLSSE